MKYIKCVKCGKKLEVEIIKENHEISEGFLYCKNCKITCPIISKIPILWDSFSGYLSNRTNLGGQLLLKSESKKMKEFVKKSLSNVKKNVQDRTLLDERWTRIYLENKQSTFYSNVKKFLKKIPHSEKVLEHGCSVGYISKFLAKHHNLVFGIDSSYHSIVEAKKNCTENLDFFVADSISHPFGQEKFGLVVALNMLEIVEPSEFLSSISKQITNGAIIISDPYDYERGTESIKKPLYEKELRQKLEKLGFKISSTTKKPNTIPWKLKINPRALLNYKVDVVVAKKS